MWDAADGKELLTLKGVSDLNSVAWSPDAKRLATQEWLSHSEGVGCQERQRIDDPEGGKAASLEPGREALGHDGEWEYCEVVELDER